MVLGHAQYAYRYRPHTYHPPLKDQRCLDCRLHDFPSKRRKYGLETCQHRTDFAPTPNPFDLLTDRGKPPNEPELPFDFIPSGLGTSKRRGRRGGRRHKAKRTPHQQPEHQQNYSLRELCDRLSSLSLQKSEPVEEVCQTWEDHRAALTAPSDVFSSESVRHQWAPQFRPNALSTTATSLVPNTEPAQHTLSQPLRRASFACSSFSTTQPPMSLVFGTPTLVPKSDGAISTQLPKSEHTDTKAPSCRKKMFVFSSPVNTHNKKDTALQLALLPKMAPPTHLPLWLPGLCDVRLTNNTPAALANPSRQHGPSVDRSAAPGTFGRWAEGRQEALAVFHDYRQNPVSRFKDFWSTYTSPHVQQCHYCQTRKSSDPICSVRSELAFMPADARQTPPWTYTALPQAGDGVDAVPSLSLDAVAHHYVARSALPSAPQSQVPPVQINNAGSCSDVGSDADDMEAASSTSSIIHHEAAGSRTATTNLGEPSSSRFPIHVEDATTRLPTHQTPASGQLAHLIAEAPHVGDGCEALAADLSPSSPASFTSEPLNSEEEYEVVPPSPASNSVNEESFEMVSRKSGSHEHGVEIDDDSYDELTIYTPDETEEENDDGDGVSNLIKEMTGLNVGEVQDGDDDDSDDEDVNYTPDGTEGESSAIIENDEDCMSGLSEEMAALNVGDEDE